MCIIITNFKKLWGSVNAEEFISTPHGLKKLLKQDQLQFSMPQVLSAFPQRREFFNRHCTYSVELFDSHLKTLLYNQCKNTNIKSTVQINSQSYISERD